VIILFDVVIPACRATVLGIDVHCQSGVWRPLANGGKHPFFCAGICLFTRPDC